MRFGQDLPQRSKMFFCTDVMHGTRAISSANGSYSNDNRYDDDVACGISGQSSVEAALLLPIILILVALLLQPVCILYTKTIMSGAASEAARLYGTSTDSDQCKEYVLRRLAAIPEIPLFHTGGKEDWLIELQKDSHEVHINITGHLRPVPPVGWLLSLTGQNGASGYVVSAQVQEKVRPQWLGGSYAEWIHMWS